MKRFGVALFQNLALTGAVVGSLSLFTLSSFGLSAVAQASSGPASFTDSPYLADRVASGELPAVADRLPSVPRVITLEGQKQAGQHGGSWRMLGGRNKDVRMMSVFGYARLVQYQPDWSLAPDILEKYEVEGERVFTLHLRPGHKWSDGHPFTTEDFRYWWEDVANNSELTPSGRPVALLVDDEAPTVEVLSPTMIRYSWSQPNPGFLHQLASAVPLFIYRPAHYLKQFHADYNAPEEMKRIVEESGRYSWAALHNSLDNMSQFDNPALPTLQPWQNMSEPPTTRYVGVRNPFFHRVDQNGLQLPYMDQVEMSIVSPQLIPAKTGTGDVDLQGRNLSFNDVTFLKQSASGEGLDVKLWKTAKSAHFALMPNLNINDPVWRDVFRDVRFRRALSLGIDRAEINQLFFFGLANPVGNGVLPVSPLYNPEHVTQWARFDLDEANDLLDDMGLTERDDRGFRKLPDGRSLEIIVETPGEDPQQVDILELVKDSYAQIGIALFNRPSQRDVLRNRVYAGETQISGWFGWENGVPIAAHDPAELAPTDQARLTWPKWGQYYQNKGEVGEAPDLPEAQRLMELWDNWRHTTDLEERTTIWQEMLQIHADQQYIIGVVSAVPQPIVHSKALMNVPSDGVWNWNPGAQFGVYNPDTFWYDSSVQ